ncbi:hypothetical protein D3C72_1688310 [compost metagenome]
MAACTIRAPSEGTASFNPATAAATISLSATDGEGLANTFMPAAAGAWTSAASSGSTKVGIPIAPRHGSCPLALVISGLLASPLAIRPATSPFTALKSACFRRSTNLSADWRSFSPQ